MKRILLTLALLLAPGVASAQCNGVFPNNTICGNISGAGNLPRPVSNSALTGVPGGTNGQVQYNNNGVFGGLTNTTLTGLINTFTSLLSGAVPASGGGTINYLRADATWAPPPGTYVFGVGSTVGTGTSGQFFYDNGGVVGQLPRTAFNICTIKVQTATTCSNGGSQANAGTYTPTAGILYFTVEMVGGGSGGSGSGTSAVVGGAGNQSSFNTSVTATAPGASAPASISAGAVGGVAGANCDLTLAGQDGQSPDITIATPPGAAGGSSFFGGGGTPGVPGTATGGAAKANTGSGGGGAGAATGVSAGSAGAAGAYCFFKVTSPSGTYSYSLGSGGGGGTGGTAAGGNGAAGLIVIREYFN